MTIMVLYQPLKLQTMEIHSYGSISSSIRTRSPSRILHDCVESAGSELAACTAVWLAGFIDGS
jgi:hypothetical protein